MKIKSLYALNRKGFSHVEIFFAIVFIAVVAFVGDRVLTASHANPTLNSALSICPSTIPSADVLKPCRPLIGATANGNPGAPSDPTSQFNYLESLISPTFKFDMYRDYDCAYSASAPLVCPDNPPNRNETNFTNNGTALSMVWNPTQQWSAADGSNAAVNAGIATAAKNIAKLNNTVYLSLWHETNLHLQSDSANSSCKVGAPVGQTTAGDAKQFVAAWQNVHNIFAQQGVKNVVWVLNYSNIQEWGCSVPDLWPGSKYVDWVTYDTYSRGKSFQDTAGAFYGYLQSLKSTPKTSTENQRIAQAGTEMDTKPWGIGEFGTCRQPTTAVTEPDYFQTMQQALAANTYPQLHMFVIYANVANTFPGSDGMGCLTNYLSDGSQSAFKQKCVNAVFETMRGNDTTCTGNPPSINSFTASPSSVAVGNTATLNWSVTNSSDCSVTPGGPSHTNATSWVTPKLTSLGVSNFALTCTNANGSTSKSVAVTVTGPTVSITTPASNATVSGMVPVNATGSSNVVKSQVVWDSTHVIRNVTATSVDQYGWGASWNSTNVPNGTHTLTVTVWDAAGNSKSDSVTVTVKN